MEPAKKGSQWRSNLVAAKDLTAGIGWQCPTPRAVDEEKWEKMNGSPAVLNVVLALSANYSDSWLVEAEIQFCCLRISSTGISLRWATEAVRPQEDLLHTHMYGLSNSKQWAACILIHWDGWKKQAMSGHMAGEKADASKGSNNSCCYQAS